MLERSTTANPGADCTALSIIWLIRAISGVDIPSKGLEQGGSKAIHEMRMGKFPRSQRTNGKKAIAEKGILANQDLQSLRSVDTLSRNGFTNTTVIKMPDGKYRVGQLVESLQNLTGDGNFYYISCSFNGGGGHAMAGMRKGQFVFYCPDTGEVSFGSSTSEPEQVGGWLIGKNRNWSQEIMRYTVYKISV